MKYLFINTSVGYGSTGKIVVNKCRELISQGHECKIAYGRQKVNCDDIETYTVGTKFDYCLHGLITRLFDKNGYGSIRATKKLINWIKYYNPDVIWLHNLHGYYLNIKILFDYLRTCDKEIKWTLHDCWAFTGHCAYFTAVGCKQWKTCCNKCQQLNTYPTCFLYSNVRKNFQHKKSLFTGIPNLTLIVPSRWLGNLVKQSYLKEYHVEVVYNTIDKNIFKPTPSNFREKYSLINKIIILGVASVWERRKGLDDFIALSNMLNDNYVIVLVGMTTKQMKSIPKKIKAIRRNDNIKELVKAYSSFDISIIENKEETYEVTTPETIKNSTYSIIYKENSNAKIADAKMGIAIEPSLNSLYNIIINNQIIKEDDPITKNEIKLNVRCKNSQINMQQTDVLQKSKRGIVKLSKGINSNCQLLLIPRTKNSKELAALYSAADVFVNPTKEDNYPTVNLEAISCGTFVITYDIGGCKETINDNQYKLT